MAKTRARAPQHRLDHIPKFVPVSDPAWNEEMLAKILLEHTESVEVDGEPVDIEPIRRYLRGRSRWDLEEPALREAIAKTKVIDLERAEIWSLRVLGFDHRLRVFGLDESGDTTQAHLVAFAHGVVGLRSPDDDDAARALTKVIEKLAPKDRKINAIQGLYEAVADYRMTAIDDVGHAVKVLSSDLFEDERKN